jgi:ABC-type polysaccharide/polyol phosphate transport system ATPase subunit
MEEVKEMTNCENAIEVENLWIGYKNIQAYSIKKSLLKLKKAHVEEFQAVRGVSFEVPKGQILGIIGKNGSGKSTMLKALAGIFCPDQGTIDLKGHTISLLSIGVGFQREVTGRENILLSGMLLGFSEEEIRAKMPEIIEFAELGRFIDMPVKTYSSGMYSKLAFSITAILETEIMLIDEVLSVGDAKFKKKSYAKMKELISNKNRTVVIVSHSEDTLLDLCDRVMWMHDGEIKRIGEPKEVLSEYREFMK